MAEDQPFQQQPEQPPVNPEEVAQAAALENGVPDPTVIEVQTDQSGDAADENEGRWDPGKAATLAAALKEEGSFDRDLEEHEDFKKKASADDYLDSYHPVKGKKNEVDYVKSEIQALENLEHKDEFTEERIVRQRQRLDRKESELAATREAVGKHTEESLRKSSERVAKVADQVLSPFEELYDLNPEAFANMPTSEFMAVAKELKEIDRATREKSEYLAEVEGYVTEVDELIAEGKELTTSAVYEVFNRLADIAWGKPDGPDSGYNEFCEAEEKQYFDPIFEGSFDKTPREKMNGVKAMYQNYASRIKEGRDAARAQREQLIAKYTPKSE